MATPDIQNWQIVASPRERFYLARFLLDNDKLKFKEKRRTQLWRFQSALGLVGPSELLTGERRGGIPKASDSTTMNLFDVNLAHADFLRECLDQVEMSAALLSPFRGIIIQLEDKTTTPCPLAAPYDVENDKWAISLAPIIASPDMYVEVNRELLRRATNFENYRQLYLESSTPKVPETPDGSTNGALAHELEPEPKPETRAS